MQYKFHCRFENPVLCTKDLASEIETSSEACYSHPVRYMPAECYLDLTMYLVTDICIQWQS